MSFSPQEKAQILREFHRNGSVTTTQSWVRRVLLKTPPRREDFLRWQENFLERGSLGHRGGNVGLEYQIKESKNRDYCLKIIPALVSAELQLLYKCLQRQFIEFCACVSASSRTECKTCISCSRLTSNIDFSLLSTAITIRMATQNSSLELHSRINTYFPSMGILIRKMPGFGDTAT